jgi:hypothetical protein
MNQLEYFQQSNSVLALGRGRTAASITEKILRIFVIDPTHSNHRPGLAIAIANRLLAGLTGPGQ